MHAWRQQHPQATLREMETDVASVVPDPLRVRADGAMVPVRHGEWADGKTLALGEGAPLLARGQPRVPTHQHASRSACPIAPP